MSFQPDFESDRNEAAKWAYNLTQAKAWCILDTETTGLDRTAEVCQVAVIDCDGNTLFNSLVKPTVKIPAEASNIHGITDEMVADARPFSEVFVDLWRAVGGRQVVIYNKGYDLRVMQRSLEVHGLILGLVDFTYQSHCAMQPYSQWVGDWNSYHGNYRWQKLPGGDHSALGDCKATLQVIRRMADSYKVPEPQEDEIPF